ncbi:hypothetical protein DAQ1742_03566 [Dickeya aquatica]|uniref:Uncharacterized protein n=1 Tax=Dickeya aquatica TaxID=1401087 RepID=A0A375AE97_9GAMM|nr:hypothetical protein DAQ1742_03566 [Dickeya aquatica]
MRKQLISGYRQRRGRVECVDKPTGKGRVNALARKKKHSHDGSRQCFGCWCSVVIYKLSV